MGPRPPAFKPILAAALAAVWFSAPAPAQEPMPGLPLPPGGEGIAPDPFQGPGAAPLPEPAPDAPAARPRQTPEEREADLLRQLAQAPDPHAAALIESELRALWSRSGSAAVDLLWKRGHDALEAGDPQGAIDHLTAAIDHAPAFAEAYAARAAAYYLTNRTGPALDDLRQALALNPHHLEALQGFAVILEELGREEDALELWRKVHDMHPRNAEAEAAVNRLEIALGGRIL